MTFATINQIPPKRRELVFSEIRRLVDEIDALDRALERIDESWSVDDALGEILFVLNVEMRRSKKRLREQQQECAEPVFSNF